MGVSMKKTLILMPMWNEEKRLNPEALISILPHADILLINDGSSDNTGDLIEKLAEKHKGMKAIHSRSNQGKGHVLQWAFHTYFKDVENYKWIAYWDADLSTPLEEVSAMVEFLEANPQYASLWGSRQKKAGARIERRFLRHVIGRSFNFVTRLLLKHPFYDSQCGAKVFSIKSAQRAFSNQFCSSWIFDLEIYLRLKKAGHEIAEKPVKEWIHKKGSKISILLDAPSILIDIIKLYRIYL
jgi:dolichyl-phosphate beta-glucosyltransferase